VAKLALFLLALMFLSIGFQWQSQHMLPWAVRGIGIAGVLLAIPVLHHVSRRRILLGTVSRWAEVGVRHPSMSVGVLAVVSFVTTVAIAYYVHGPYPHISDGFGYYFQAKIFAGHALFAPAPPLPEFFQFEWVAVHGGRWFSIFPPGWPLLLAAGIKLGVPALVNPFLGSLCVIVIFHLARALFGLRQALLCALFCCLSPFFLFMSSEFMSHTAALLLTSLSTLLHVRARLGSAGMTRFIGSGALAGMAFLVRPVDALAIWIGQTVHGLWVDRSRRAVLGAFASAVPLACGVGGYLIYNRLLMGTWWSSPLLLVSPRNRMGFGADIGYDWAFPTPGHSPWRALLNLNHNAAVMSQDLFGWPITSLAFVLLLAVFGRKDARHGLGGAIIASTVAAYALYWYHGEAFGARFYFTLLPFLLMLTVDGIRQTPDIVTRLLPDVGRDRIRRLLPSAVAALFAFGWIVYVPKISLIAPYYNHKGVNSGFRDFERNQPMDEAIVFVRVPEPLYYGPAFIANELPIGKGRVIYAVDRGEQANQALVALFPGRTVRRYAYERLPYPVRTWLDAQIRRLW
jgi:hypothetical protein